jgi:predicted metal-dependent hydrolase
MATELPYTIVRKPRRRSVTLSISPRNHLTVTVPKSFSDSQVEKFIAQQSRWIEKKIRRNRILGALYPPKKYQNGDCFTYLGQSYRLEVAEAERRSIQIIEDRLRVEASPLEILGNREENVASIVQAWYEGMALQTLRERVAFYEERMGLRSKAVRVRTLASQWGSCAVTGHLCFNSRLVMAPLEVVDYVVVHELSHLVHHNHSPRFWGLVAAFIPDYHKRRKWLREHGNFLTLD